MKYKKISQLLLLTVLIGIFLISCTRGQSSVEIGMVETHLPGNWQASYATFTGAKSDRFNAETGQTLIVEYEVRVEKGTLTLQVLGPDDQVLWEEMFQGDQSDTARVSITEAGRYAISIEGQDTGGGWDLTWSVQ